MFLSCSWLQALVLFSAEKTVEIVQKEDRKIQDHRTMRTRSLAAYPRAQQEERSIVNAAARKLVVTKTVLNRRFGVSSARRTK